MDEIERHKTTLVFCNTRSLAELIFQDLWAVNERRAADRHPPRLLASRGAAQGRGRIAGPAARAGLHRQPRPRRRLGRRRPRRPDGRPKGSSRLVQRIGRANHRLDEPCRGVLVPGNRFEYLEARAALDAIEEGELDGELSAPARSTCSPSTSWRSPAPAPFRREALLVEVAAARLMPGSMPRPSPACSASSRPAAMRCAPRPVQASKSGTASLPRRRVQLGTSLGHRRDDGRRTRLSARRSGAAPLRTPHSRSFGRASAMLAKAFREGRSLTPDDAVPRLCEETCPARDVSGAPSRRWKKNSAFGSSKRSGAVTNASFEEFRTRIRNACESIS